MHAHKPKFALVFFFFFLLNPFQILSCSFSFYFFPAFLSLFLSTLHILLSGRKRLNKIIGKPGKGDVDQLQVCWPVYAPIRSVFFSISSVRMQSIYKMHGQSTLCQFFFFILFVYCFIKLNIQFQQIRNV